MVCVLARRLVDIILLDIHRRCYQNSGPFVSLVHNAQQEYYLFCSLTCVGIWTSPWNSFCSTAHSQNKSGLLQLYDYQGLALPLLSQRSWVCILVLRSFAALLWAVLTENFWTYHDRMQTMEDNLSLYVVISRGRYRC